MLHLKKSAGAWPDRDRRRKSYSVTRIKILYTAVNVGVCVSTGIVFLDWTLPPASVTSGWKVQEELPAWTAAGANSVFSQLIGMRDGRFSLWVTSKAKRGKHVNSLELIRFKSSLSWCVSFFGTFTSAFVLFQFSRWRMYSWRNVRLFLRWTRVQIEVYIFISTRLVSLIFGPSCCCKTRLCFTFVPMALRKVWIHLFSFQLWVNSRAD